MSDIMEKVAREMAVAEGWAITKSTIADYLPAADAALSACGWQEMVEALDELSMQCEREFGDLKEEPDDASVFAKEDSTPTITFGAIRRARAAVKKARGGT